MAIDWIYDTTYVSFGVDWNAAYKAVGKVTIQPVVYRWDRYNTADGSKFSETLRYEPNGLTGSWSNIGWGSGSGTRSVDPFNQRTYERRASAYTVQLKIETSSGFGTAYDGYFHTIGEVTRTATYTVPALPPAFNTLSATRVSDNQVNLSWTAASGNIGAVCIERSVDGGSFSEVAVIWNASATSWQDNATTADHSYTYRARYHHEGAYGAYSNTVTVTMTPSAPQTITTAAAGGTNIDVTLTNPSPVATKVQYQVSTDGGANWGATQDSASLTSLSVSASGTVKVRVRNWNATGTSDWLESDVIVTITPPAAPTLKSPSGVFSTAEGDIVFEWQFNTVDGSKQTAYKLSWENDDGTVTGTTGKVSSSDSTYSMQNPFAVGDEVNWSLQTWGAATTGGYDGYGSSDPDWLDFYVFSPPTLSITSPSATITGMPVNLTATYSDMAGYTCNFASVKLTQNGREVYPNDPNKGTSASGDVTITTVGGVTTITASLTTDEFLPTNGESYTVVLTARSSSGLQTSANATFTVDFVEPQAGELSITNDPETGYASLLATFDNSASEITYTGSTNAQYESSEGYVRSLTVEGKSEKWNQCVGDSATSVSSTKNGMTIARNTSNRFTFGGTWTWVAGDLNAYVGTNISGIVEGHKYYVNSNSNYICLNLYGGWTCPNTYPREYIVTAGSGSYNTAIRPLGTIQTTTFSPNESNVKFTVIDLTAIYGAGNEPTALTDPRIAWLKAYALAHPDYDAGSLVSIEGAGVVGRNLATTAVYKQDYVIGGSGAESAAGDYIITEAVPIEAGETYAGSYGHANPSSTDPLRVGIYTSAMVFISRPVINDSTHSITMPDNAAFVRFSYATAGSNALMDVMFSKGSTLAPYEPYSLTTITTPLRSAGSVHDELQVDGTEAQVARKVGTATYDGTEANWTAWNSSAVADGAMFYYIASSNTAVDRSNSLNLQLVSTGFVYDGSYSTVPSFPGRFYFDGSNEPCFVVPKADFPTLADFKTWLDTHPVSVNYPLKEASQTTDTLPDIDTIEIGSAFTVATDLDTTFEMTTWDGSADAVSISVSRVNPDGTLTPLLTDGASGSGLVDRYAPLNTPYQYAVTTTADTQAVKTVYVDNELVTDLWFVYWVHRDGDTVTDEIAWAKWNPSGNYAITRPEKKRVHYVGRKWALSYDSRAMEQTQSISWTAVPIDDWENGFERLMGDGGRGVYKGCDGWVYHADFDYSNEPNYTSIGGDSRVSLSITRIDGEQL